ncbi:murein transglycosylase A [Planktotalea sp.]|uniref:murein transglycosylase A n=1 Tax=Planktotalea sp. TaxID=2029877 RepID=UPI0025DA9A4E|nr:murein transglycosylase A [Planktotalea sp.]
MSAPAHAETVYSILDFKELDGWADDDHQAALDTFRDTCRDMKTPDWRTLCRTANDQKNARAFFELFFRPLLIQDGKNAMFTGYFEPELDGSRTRTARYKYPIYAMPRDAKTAGQWYTRRQIFEDGVMDGLNLEICYVDDPVELFFLQIQGSGRVRLPDGSFLRVGFGGSNRHNYRSIGQEMVRRGIYEPHQVSAEVIKNWVRRNPEDGKELLFHNPSYVFFREVSEVPADKGPLGAMNRSIKTMRSIAVDPKFTPLGAPVWIEKDGKAPLRRLMIAQDTGSTIKGAQRADVFFGTGDKAGKEAGSLRDTGRMVVLMPIQRAYAYLPENVQ